ncbi:MAG: DUF6036 family nucleotidyltransferase [Acidobacteriota bacterium]
MTLPNCVAYTDVVIGEIERLLIQLTEAGVRYLVVGGVAVVLHGYLRATADLDLVIDLSPGNVATAIDVLGRLGFHPRAPVELGAFSDAEERANWIEEKNLQVFSVWHPEIPGFELDLFVKLPFNFDEVYARATIARLGNTDVTVASIDDLVEMKRKAGRPRDQEDIEALLALQEANERRT